MPNLLSANAGAINMLYVTSTRDCIIGAYLRLCDGK
jgi:hypothetical protein